MKEEAGFNTIILLIERKGFSMSNGIARNTPDTIQIANDAREILPICGI